MPKFLGDKPTSFDSISPTTSKGDLAADNGTSNVRIAVGADGQVLTADSTQAAGLKWATPAGGGAAYAATIGDGTSTDIVVTHNLGTQDVDVAVRAAASPYGSALVAWDATSTNTITLHFTTAPTTGQYRVSVLSGAAAGGGGGSGAPTTSTYIVQAADASLPNAQALGSLATGLVKVTTTTGVLSTAVAGTDYVVPSGSITGTAANVTGTVAVANGGTGQTAYTDGQLLIGNTSTGGLSRATLTAGTNITITNAGGAITIAATGGGGNSFSQVGLTGSTSGLTVLQAQAVAGGTFTFPTVVCSVPGVLATGTTSVTQGTKNTTATVLGTAAGTGLFLGTGTFGVGRTVRLRVYGTATTTATSPAAITFLCKLGTTTVATTVAYTPASAATNVRWTAEVVITCRTTGTTGTVFAQGRVELLLTTTPVVLGMANTTTQTIDTTASQTVDFQVTESNATGTQSVTATNYTLEILN